jgi:hypothetical protein
MEQCKSKDQDFKSYAYEVFSCKSEGTDVKRDYAEEQLRENMGQSQSKKRVFKE